MTISGDRPNRTSPGDRIPTRIDPARPAADPPDADRRNELSEALLGRDHRFAFGSEGEARVPSVSRDDLALSEGAAQRLSATRIYLFPGTPWPGVAQKGTAWLEPWAKALEAAGVGRAVPVRYTDSSALASNLKMYLEPLTHQQRDAAMARIEADLRERPLKPGERIFVVGHSYGARLGAEVSDVLVNKGLPVAGFVALEDRVAPVGRIVSQAPRVPRVTEVENRPGSPLETHAGTEYRRLVLPAFGHMDVVLRPPDSLMVSLIEEFSR